jgi:hypothetical protein
MSFSMKETDTSFTKLDCRKEERVRRIVDLSLRGDRILEAPGLHLYLPAQVTQALVR